MNSSLNEIEFGFKNTYKEQSLNHVRGNPNYKDIRTVSSNTKYVVRPRCMNSYNNPYNAC
ncbi:hypothetical protein MA16_Dca029231 [Dendrobium catenatum]|uniref:Uncharacterized protein n=1 Tax=Dendrobium catenatum TaxID=906689 RepID=A0A2I0VFC8_9ASPA|nr:hypothetical protein MA16_Dca029231 [Dendrobium catenatum]